MSLSRGNIIFALPPTGHTNRGNAPPPYVFCIFEFIFRYLLASPFGFVYYVLTQIVIGFILAVLL